MMLLPPCYCCHAIMPLPLADTPDAEIVFFSLYADAAADAITIDADVMR